MSVFTEWLPLLWRRLWAWRRPPPAAVTASSAADPFWRSITATLPFVPAAHEAERLVELALSFLAQKKFWGAQGLTLTPEMAATVAYGAALLAYREGLTLFDDFVGVVLYPAPFRVYRRWEEGESGIVHESLETLDGETWENGPVVVAWLDDPLERWAVIVHELAHRLDAALGGIWGPVWEASWSRACEAFDANSSLPFDDYALTDPVEFVAVTAEAFVLTPDLLKNWDSALYWEWSRITGLNPARMAREPDCLSERREAS